MNKYYPWKRKVMLKSHLYISLFQLQHFNLHPPHMAQLPWPHAHQLHCYNCITVFITIKLKYEIAYLGHACLHVRGIARVLLSTYKKIPYSKTPLPPSQLGTITCSLASIFILDRSSINSRLYEAQLK